MYFISYSTPRVKSNVHNKTHQLLCVSNPNLLKTHLFIKRWTSRCLELTEKKKDSTHGIDRNLIHSNHLNLWSVLKASNKTIVFKKSHIPSHSSDTDIILPACSIYVSDSNYKANDLSDTRFLTIHTVLSTTFKFTMGYS